jgi:Zn-dependent peptidase ImmA (M78 family)
VLRQEREADEFAAHILMPETELEKLGNPTTWDIAEHFGVPEELATLRLEQFATERERVCWPLFDEI